MAFDTCYNKGCGQKFDPNSNTEDSCQYHPGGPVFHDAMKGWSCCKKRTTDFTEFLNTPGCTRGRHSNVKPVEPETPKPESNETNEVIVAEPEKISVPKVVQTTERPSHDEPMQQLKVTVGDSLKQALERQLNDLSLQSSEASGDQKDGIQIGASCKNHTCKAIYQGEESNKENCCYHPGGPVFHEGMKFWSCCKRKTSDFGNFLDQAGCETGFHIWTKPKTSGEKKACRFDWYQTNANVIVSVFSKVAKPDESYIEANRVSCNIHIVFDGGKSLFDHSIQLYDVIDPLGSSVTMLGSKVEINLKKAEPFQWRKLHQEQNSKQQAEEEEDQDISS